jgi:hypothetical protein
MQCLKSFSPFQWQYTSLASVNERQSVWLYWPFIVYVATWYNQYNNQWQSPLLWGWPEETTSLEWFPLTAPFKLVVSSLNSPGNTKRTGNCRLQMSTCFSCFKLAIGIMIKYFVFLKMTYSSRHSLVSRHFPCSVFPE